MVAQLIEEFDEAAQSWGWEKDQGTGRYVDVSMRRYELTKAVLVSQVVDMEATLAMIEMHKEKLV